MYILFDLDGTLTDSEYLHNMADAFILKKFNVDFKKELENKTFTLDETTGLKQMKVFDFYIKLFNLKTSSDFLLEEKIKYFKKIKIKLYRGMDKTLKKLKKEHKLAIVTSGHPEVVEIILEKTKIKPYFDVIITSEDVSEGKPSPIPFESAMKKFKAKRDECIVIEDSVNGIISGKKAGMISIGVSNTFDPEILREAGADYVCLNSLLLFNTINWISGKFEYEIKSPLSEELKGRGIGYSKDNSYFVDILQAAYLTELKKIKSDALKKVNKNKFLKKRYLIFRDLRNKIHVSNYIPSEDLFLVHEKGMMPKNSQTEYVVILTENLNWEYLEKIKEYTRKARKDLIISSIRDNGNIDYYKLQEVMM
jgi:beta-phosphoglucomutase